LYKRYKAGVEDKTIKNAPNKGALHHLFTFY